MTIWHAKDILEIQDAKGAPYTIPSWYSGEPIPIDYGMARAIADSAHPSRVVANTSVYRYAKFVTADDWLGSPVDVTMMGQHIATFTREGVRLWSRGYVTVSTTEALGNLCDSAWFYTRDQKIYCQVYAPGHGIQRDGREIPFTEGQTFPYRSEDK